MSSASLTFFARHEIGLFWRDWTALALRGRWRRKIIAGLVLAIFLAGMHAVAWLTVADTAGLLWSDPQAVYVFISGCALVSFSLMLSQALESVTRAFYARADLDLILTSPAPSSRIFTIRILAVALTSVVMSGLLIAPFLNVLALMDGFAWLLGYPALLAMSATATALALTIAIVLFRTVGPKLTRSIAQIMAAIIGAGFAIALQLAAILYFDDMSRLSILTAPEVTSAMAGPDSWLWIPARAFAGDGQAVLTFVLIGFGCLTASIVLFSSRFATLALSTAGVREISGANRRPAQRFRSHGVRQTLRRKELLLLARDPWLLSQSLTQMLYLVVPAFLLWRNFGADIGSVIVAVPVMVMASGQLAGGLAWLTICGEDAPDLIKTAPMRERDGLRAKIEAVLMAVGLVVVPIIIFLGLVHPRAGLATAICVILSASAATAMQVWFRAQAQRDHFRHRHASSKIATISEAFSSICWAGTAVLLAIGDWLGWLSAALAFAVLGFVWVMRPRDVD